MKHSRLICSGTFLLALAACSTAADAPGTQRRRRLVGTVAAQRQDRAVRGARHQHGFGKHQRHHHHQRLGFGFGRRHGEWRDHDHHDEWIGWKRRFGRQRWLRR